MKPKFKIDDRVVIKINIEVVSRHRQLKGHIGIVIENNYIPIAYSPTQDRPRYVVKLDNNASYILPETLMFRGCELEYYANPLQRLKERFRYDSSNRHSKFIS